MISRNKILVLLMLVTGSMSAAMVEPKTKKPLGTIYIPGQGRVKAPALTATQLRILREKLGLKYNSARKPAQAPLEEAFERESTRTEAHVLSPRPNRAESPVIDTKTHSVIEIKEPHVTEAPKQHSPKEIEAHQELNTQENHKRFMEQLKEAEELHNIQEKFIQEVLASGKKTSDETNKILNEVDEQLYGQQDKSGKTALHNAVISQNIPLVKKIVKTYHKGVTIPDHQSWLPLHYAAQGGKIKIVKILLKADRDTASVAEDKHDHLPLHLAVINNHPAAAFKLMQAFPNGAKCKDKNGLIPLHWAAFGSSIETVKALIKRFPEGIRSRNNIGNYPVDLARERGRTEVAKLINPGKGYDMNGITAREIMAQLEKEGKLTEEASINRVDSIKFTEDNNDDDIEFHEEETPPVKEDRDDWSPLHKAIAENSINEAKVLSENTEKLTAIDNLGRTPLHLAAQYGRTKLINQAFENKLTPELINMKDAAGMTAIHKAALNNHSNIVRLFLTKGGEIMAKDKEDNTLLHLAAMSTGDVTVYELLKHNKINVHAVNKHNRTALYLAVEAGNAFAISWLLDADKNQQDTTKLMHLAQSKLKDLKKIKEPTEQSAKIKLGTTIDLYQRTIGFLKPIPQTPVKQQEAPKTIWGHIKSIVAGK